METLKSPKKIPFGGSLPEMKLYPEETMGLKYIAPDDWIKRCIAKFELFGWMDYLSGTEEEWTILEDLDEITDENRERNKKLKAIDAAITSFLLESVVGRPLKLINSKTVSGKEKWLILLEEYENQESQTISDLISRFNKCKFESRLQDVEVLLTNMKDICEDFENNFNIVKTEEEKLEQIVESIPNRDPWKHIRSDLMKAKDAGTLTWGHCKSTLRNHFKNRVKPIITKKLSKRRKKYTPKRNSDSSDEESDDPDVALLIEKEKSEEMWETDEDEEASDDEDRESE